MVVGDDGVGSVQNGRGGAVILLQPDGPCPPVLILEVQDVLDGGATEAVDGLVIVAHHAEVLVAARQQAGQQILHIISVLILVHQHITELPLIMLANGIKFLQELDGQIDDVVKIHCVVFLQLSLVAAVALGDLDHAHVVLLLGGPGTFLGGDHAVLLPGDDGQHQLGREGLVVQPHILEDILHDLLGVRSIINGEAAAVAQMLDVRHRGHIIGILVVLPQDAAAGGVEGHGPDAPGAVAQHPLQTLLELAGGLVGEGDGQHPVGIHGHLGAEAVGPLPLSSGQYGTEPLQKFRILFHDTLGDAPGLITPSEADEVGDAVDEDGGLAGARTRQQQQRALGSQSGGALHGIQVCEPGFDILPAGSQEAFFKGVIHSDHLSVFLCYRTLYDTANRPKIQVPQPTRSSPAASRWPFSRCGSPGPG